MVASQAASSPSNDPSDETAVNLSELFHINGTLPLQPAALEKRTTTSPPGVLKGCYWNVAGIGKFNSHLQVTNMTAAVSDSRTPLIAYTSTGYPCPQLEDADAETGCVRYDLANINLDQTDNSLTLTVPGGQTSKLISCAKFGTNWTDILYGSVRTVARTSNVAGTVHGAFFYSNDTQETDIEFQTTNPGFAH